MIAGLDSSSEPSTQQIQQAADAGVKLWGGYAGPYAYHDWLSATFADVRAAGMQPLVFVFPGSDVAFMRQAADNDGALLCLDNAVGDTPNPYAPTTEGWLKAARSANAICGMYGQQEVLFYWKGQYDFAILAHPVPDPQSNDPGLKLGVPTGWQWWNTHSEFGIEVDRGWYDDWFSPEGEMTQDLARGLVRQFYAGVLHREVETEAVLEAHATAIIKGGYEPWITNLIDNPQDTEVRDVMAADYARDHSAK